MTEISGIGKNVPLFPLGAVLFPNGYLSLRIFEPRYLSMIGDRMKSNSPFGVVLIKEGSEAGQPAAFHSIGTLAAVIDFDQLEDGTLGITCKGSLRFRVLSHKLRNDNLIIADIDLIDTDEAEISAETFMNEFQPVSDFLQQTLGKKELENYRKGIEEDWNDSNWISYQMAELLPLSADSRQIMLEMSTLERLSELKFVLKENNLIE